MNQVKGFTLSIVIVIISFVASAFAAGFLADLAGVWKKPIIGAVAAFCVVIIGYVTAPSHKRMASVIWLVVGAISAWFLAGDSYYPEDYEHAYQLTIIPLLATYLSGLFAVLLCMVRHKKQNNKNISLDR
jgi:MFS family permease